VHFTAKSNTKINIKINFEDTQINNICNVIFLGLNIDNTLLWKEKIEHLASKLSSADYSISSLESTMSQKCLRKIYFSYVHSTIS